jgi:hypothetical protein
MSITSGFLDGSAAWHEQFPLTISHRLGEIKKHQQCSCPNHCLLMFFEYGPIFIFDWGE